MVIEHIIKGLIVGIAISAPLGPLGILTIQRTINKGFISGFISGFGAAFADIIYAAIAGFGISIIADFLDTYQLLIRVLGGLLIAVLGVRITITNPLTVIVFGAVFTGLELDNSEARNLISYTLIGMFCGAIIWWFSLTMIVNIFRKKIRLRNLWWINKITGGLIVVFGIAVFVSILFMNKGNL